jgi:hypothetical protein
MIVRQPVGLGKIAKLINAGKIDSSELITMKTLKVLSETVEQLTTSEKINVNFVFW